MMRKKPKIETEFDLETIEPGSFLIFRTDEPSYLIDELADHTQKMKERNITGIILDRDTQIESLSRKSLLELGLFKLPESKLLN